MSIPRTLFIFSFLFSNGVFEETARSARATVIVVIPNEAVFVFPDVTDVIIKLLTYGKKR